MVSLKQEQVAAAIEQWAKDQLKNVDAGHDWWHIQRVLANAQLLHQAEGGDWQVIHMAVLLHDVADPKFFDEQAMLHRIDQKLTELEVHEEVRQHIINIISSLSFSKQWENKPFDSLEFRIVQDADRLDAIGAVGIARAFSYGGHKGRVFFDPEIAPQQYDNSKAYRNSESPTINHFYEKLLLLKDRMKTIKGRQMAEERHTYMQSFLVQFFSEIGYRSEI